MFFFVGLRDKLQRIPFFNGQYAKCVVVYLCHLEATKQNDTHTIWRGTSVLRQKFFNERGVFCWEVSNVSTFGATFSRATVLPKS